MLFFAFAAALVLGLVTVWSVGRLRRWLLAHGVHDMPNARSSHRAPKPRGAGLAVVPLAALAWGVSGLATAQPASFYLPPVFAVALCLLSFRDDVRGLPPVLRLAAQAAAVAAGVAVFEGGLVFQGLVPLWLDRVLAGLAWLWFLNLFNFMDGIDGISGVETGVIGLGLIAVGSVAGWPGAAMLPPLWLVAVAAGFLIWNWAPSRIFLGDSGSIGLAVLLGWLLLDAAARGQWAVALILPGYYWADATLTLLRRLSRGAKIWHAHREHAYQRAVRAGWPHGRVSALVGAAGLGLIGAAVLAAGGAPFWGLAAGAVLVTGALAVLGRAADPRGPARAG
jgi:UDP-N-acetylmuramyl pentapeptide phosphotransferase/UDP-N-acetylglucosamine-1-phosphate transferase